MKGKYLVQSVERANKKDGAVYLKLKLFEKGGKTWDSKYWADAEVEAGNVIDALAEEGEYNGTPQLTVKQFSVLDEKAGMEFLPHTTKNVEDMFFHLTGFVTMVKDQDIRLLLEKAIEDPRWKIAPAAMSMHQGYIGGLLEHVVSLCRLCHQVSLLYDPHLRTDLLVAAAILHDIGKQDELQYTSNISYTDAGSLIGHTSIGFQRVSRMMDQLKTPSIDSNGVSEDTRLLIEHMILSHHGQKDWGAPVVPMVIEAQVFHHLDYMDAQVSAMIENTEKSRGKVWTEYVKSTKARLYLGKPITIAEVA